MSTKNKYRYTELNSFAQVKAQKHWIDQLLGFDATYDDMEHSQADDNLTENDFENWFTVKGEIL